MAEHHEESLLDKMKNAIGMGGDERVATAERPAGNDAFDDDGVETWAGVPPASESVESEPYPSDEPSGLGRNPGPMGSAAYEDGAMPDDFGGADVGPDGTIDLTREEIAATEFGGAYGPDDTPMPTEAAWDRGEATPMPGDPSVDDDDPFERRDADPI